MIAEKEASKLLGQYSRAITHLRSQVQKNRFGLVLGAGISTDFGAPGWKDLVNSISADQKVDGVGLIQGSAGAKASFPYKTELLFQRFCSRHPARRASLTSLELQNTIAADWLKLCQKYLYPKSAPDLTTAIGRHPFLKSLIPLVQNSYLTINFNFDDYLERALALHKRPTDAGNRGFEAVTDPWPQFRRTDCVIYHPHGYVPFGLMEKAVDRFVFSEASYSKQYVGARGHDASFLLAHFARNTCLLIGCSLEDELRNVLLRGAEVNPGNYHYYVHFVRGGTAAPSDDEKRFIQETNFKVYNLITLFLTAKDIDQVLQMVNHQAVPNAVLNDLALRCGAGLKFTYYMTGAIGVGKSTTTNLLRNLTVMDEWQESRLEILGKPWDKLTPGEQRQADEWIVGQFKKKNDSLRHLEGPVISVVDRPPLDPLVFTKPAKRAAKAKALLDAICPDRGYEVEEGVVILLLGDPKELSARVRATGRTDYDPTRLRKMQEAMKDIYGPYSPNRGVVIIDTTYMSIAELTKRVAEIIHRKEYKPANLMAILKSHESS